MKKYLIIFFLNLNFVSFGQNCTMLENGKYEVQYDGQNQISNWFEINGNHYYTNQDGVKKDYEIKMLNNCSFQLKSNDKVDESKLTEFQKKLAKQESFFEITKVEGNIYFFVCRVDLHIQCGTGKFIKKE